jgi:RNA polymerase sigma-70 factor (ECF subfamily)
VPKTATCGPSDEELVRAIARGEQEALRKLNERYGHALAAVAERILNDKSDSEEVAADVLWQVWRQAITFDRQRGSVGTWLMMQVRTRAIDRLRARKVREAVSSQPTDPREEADPALELHSAGKRRVVAIALAKLRDNERALLELAYYSDLSQSAIAESTGLPLGTVKSRIRSALIRLREELKDVGD